MDSAMRAGSLNFFSLASCSDLAQLSLVSNLSYSLVFSPFPCFFPVISLSHRSYSFPFLECYLPALYLVMNLRVGILQEIRT